MLPKRERLAREREIKGITSEKQYETKGPLLYFVARDNLLSFSRLAVVVPKKLGSAPKRNRIRRRLYEIFGKLKPKIAISLDIVVFVRSAALLQGYSGLLIDFMGGLNDLENC